MGMSGMILDNVEQFWNICHETIGQCATAEEWEAVMTPHLHLLQGSEDLEHVLPPGNYAHKGFGVFRFVPPADSPGPFFILNFRR